MSHTVPQWSQYSDFQLETAITHLRQTCEKKRMALRNLQLAASLVAFRRFPVIRDTGALEQLAMQERARASHTIWEASDLLRAVQLHSIWLESQGTQGQCLDISRKTFAPLLHFQFLWLVRMQGTQAQLAHRDFSDANLTRANLRHAQCDDALFDRVCAVWLDAPHLHAPRSSATYANFAHANLVGAQLQDCVWPGANLQGANLSGADLSGADLRGAHLSHAVLRDANLRGVQWEGADLSHADFSGSTMEPAISPATAIVYDTVGLPHMEPTVDPLFQ